MASETNVQRYQDISSEDLRRLLERYQLELVKVPARQIIPGSFWGDDEAGLKVNRLYVRPDTPLHSILHEACHYICMSPERRSGLDTNAGGDYEEENAVCYLQILLADQLPDSSAARAQEDMNRWGYGFRLGSAQAWFDQDADDARRWLVERGLIMDNDPQSAPAPTWTLNTRPDTPAD